MPKNKTSFKPGQVTNPKGRVKGIQDIRTKVWSVQATLERMGYDPIEALIKMAKDETIENSVRIKANVELTSRIAPLLKQIDQNHKGTVNVDIPALTAKFEDAIAKAKVMNGK